MKRIVVYIPARMGSQRVPQKNIRLLGGKPLIGWAIEAARAADVFAEIYVNSEADAMGRIARDFGVKFYKRPERLSSHTAVNDDFALDFIQNVRADVVIQLLPTSPLITPGEIHDFVGAMIKGRYDTLVSVIDHQIACVYEGQPVNFSTMEKHRPSQNMVPVQSYASVLMAWDTAKFLEHDRQYGFAYHGADGKTGYYPLKGLSVIDIDHEEDFIMAEVAMAFRNNKTPYEKKYYGQ